MVLEPRPWTLVPTLLLDVAYLLLSPFLLFFWLIASRLFTRPKYRRGLRQKLGAVPVREGDGPGLWIHAVSVGEVLASVPLVEAMAARFPDWDISLSVTTPTGFDVARQRFPDRTVFYYPFDSSLAVARSLSRRKPAVVILMELEVWPNFLLTARRRGIPVFVVNGRLTERSCRRYQRSGPLGRSLFAQVAAYGVQNETYAARFRRLGVDAERIAILGNLKYDRAPPANTGADDLRRRLGWSADAGDLILVGGCTHPGEEAMLCSAVAALRSVERRLRLILAPRHVERLVAGEVESWSASATFVRWSRLHREEAPGGVGDAVVVVDTVGELERFYALADLVVVGGSFVPHGGHNVLEPAALGKPTLFGPHCRNFAEECDYLLENDAAVRVECSEEVEAVLRGLLESPARRRQLGEQAGESVKRLRGAAARYGDWLEAQMRLFLPDENC